MVFLYPAIAFFQMHTSRLLEIRQTDLTVAAFVHTVTSCASFLTCFNGFPCTAYTTLQSPAPQEVLIYSADII